jgi:hypothetical protein
MKFRFFFEFFRENLELKKLTKEIEFEKLQLKTFEHSSKKCLNFAVKTTKLKTLANSKRKLQRNPQECVGGTFHTFRVATSGRFRFLFWGSIPGVGDGI